MNIIVTGCSSGIGYKTVLALAQMGSHNIFAISRNSVGLNQLKQEFQQLNSESSISAISFDLNQDSFDYLFSKFNFSVENPLDILINNAGVLFNKPFNELKMEEWYTSFNVNLFSSVKLIKGLYSYFNRVDGSHIVNIGSMGGVQGTAKFSGLSAYSTSKAAVNALTESLSVEFENEGIHVNAINPGAVQTQMLEEAFPDYKAEISSTQMGHYIANFAINNKDIMNGRLIQASLKS
ncbi:MAG: SDR family oxidoreductase [Bacteroidales bacterium]|nr:SDR family oxidoreductase [Bacteroidales bacterium]